MKKALGFISGASLYLFSAVSVFAQLGTPIPLKPPAGSIPESTEVSKIPQFVITLLFILGTIIAIAFLIYGGIRWVLSGGDKAKVEAARGHIVAAIIGLVIIAGAFFIINIVFTLLGQKFELGNLCIPTLTTPNCK